MWDVAEETADLVGRKIPRGASAVCFLQIVFCILEMDGYVCSSSKLRCQKNRLLNSLETVKTQGQGTTLSLLWQHQLDEGLTLFYE